MQCKQCGYRLWNIQSRNCPECGQGFSPSEFDYVPGSVAFCCPHCDKTYTGSDEQGHLPLRVLDCEGCGQRIHMDEMVVRPTETMPSLDTVVVEHPWLQRSHWHDLFLAWLRTILCTFIHPSKLAGSEGNRRGKYEHLKFILVNAFLVTVPCNIIYRFRLDYVMLFDSEMWWAEWMRLLLLAFVLPLLICGSIIAGTGIWAMFTHGLMRLMSKPKSDFDATQKVLAYVSGVLVLSYIPYIPFESYFLLALLMWYLIGSFVLKTIHGVSLAVAFISNSTLPLCFGVLYFWIFILNGQP